MEAKRKKTREEKKVRKEILISFVTETYYLILLNGIYFRGSFAMMETGAAQRQLFEKNCFTEKRRKIFLAR